MATSLTTNPFPTKRTQVDKETKQMRAILRRWNIKATAYSRFLVVRESETVGYVTDTYGLRVMTPNDADWNVLFANLEVGKCHRITKKGHDAEVGECEPPELRKLIDANPGTDPIDMTLTRAFQYGEHAQNLARGFVFTTVSGVQVRVELQRTQACYVDGERLVANGDPIKSPVTVLRGDEVVGLMMPTRGIPEEGPGCPNLEWVEVGR